jgi:ABC-2 type transport system ATP-binding protein
MPRMTNARIAARGISKRYGRRAVLDNVDLTVRAGEIVAVVGANGSGKSTLLKICAGLVGADRGTVTVDGTIGYCPQDAGLLPFLRPDEHFILYGAGRGLTRPQSRRRGRRLAAALAWTGGATTQARHLSGGTQQKLNVVLAALGDPDVILMDEPYQGFDHGSYVDFWDCLAGWRATGRSVVVVTHLLHELHRVDRVLTLEAA